MTPDTNHPDRYTKLRLLGEGGAGRVWLAQDREQGGREVAVKELLGEGADRQVDALRREFAVLASLTHPNLADVYTFDLDPESGLPRFSLEYVDGEPVTGAIQKEGAEAFLRLAAEALRALAFLHDFDLVHRDLKPANLLVRRRPKLDTRLVVLDFGLALQGRGEGMPATGLSGTLPYLAPELFEGATPGRRTDLYALGAVLWEAIHGTPPVAFEGREIGRAVQAIKEGRRRRPPLPEGYPEAVAGWLESMLAPRPEDRPAGAREALARLASAWGARVEPETEATRLARLRSGEPAGREQEARALWSALEQADRPRVVWLEGEAGMGKSRLLRWLVSRAVGEGWEVLEPRPELPLAGEADATTFDEALSDHLAELRRRAGGHPVLIVVDEAETAGARLGRLIERVAREGREAPLRVVAAVRPAEIRDPALRKLHGQTGLVPTLARVELKPLGVESVSQVAARAAGGGSVSESRARWLWEQSEGNPLVLETLLLDEAWQRRKTDKAAEAARGLAASITRRLASLTPEARGWLELLAVWGTAEPIGLERLAALGGEAGLAGHLEDALEALAGLGLVERGETGIRAASRRVAEQALEEMPAVRRRALYRTAASWLAREDAGAVAQQARLWRGAGAWERALEAAESQARAAEGRQHWGEAVQWLRFALQTMGRRGDRARRLDLRLRLGEALLEVGYLPDAARSFGAAVRLAREPRLRARALSRQAYALALVGHTDHAARCADEAKRIAEEIHDPVEMARALFGESAVMFTRGQLPQARTLLRTARRQLESQHGSDHVLEADVHYSDAVLADLMCAPDTDEAIAEALARSQSTASIARRARATLLSLNFARTGPGVPLSEYMRLHSLMSRHGLDRLKLYADRAYADELGSKGFLDQACSLCEELEIQSLHLGTLELAVTARVNYCEYLGCAGRASEALGKLKSHRYDLTRVRAGCALSVDVCEGYLLSFINPEQAISVLESKFRAAVSQEALTQLVPAIAMFMVEAMAYGSSARVGPDWQQVNLENQYSALGSRSHRPEIHVRYLAARATLEQRLGRPSEAVALGEEALALARKHDYPLYAAKAAHALALAKEDLGDPGAAREHRRLARELLQTAASRIQDPDMRRDFLARKDLQPILGDNTGARETARLHALYDMIRAVNSETDPDVLLERILDLACQVVGAERGMILLRDERTGDFAVRLVRNLEPETAEDAERFSRGIVGKAGQGESILALDAGSDERFKSLRSVSLYQIRSLMCVPLRNRGRITGTVYLDSRREGKPFTQEDLRFVEAFADHAALALENARARARLEEENRRLLVAAEERVRLGNLVGRCEAMQQVFDLIDKAAPTGLPVLIQGESGTGKELVARAIHFRSPRKHKPFVTENCAAVPETLLESELFGHVRGAFTGAERDRAGLFEQADGGTLFLDEVGDMSPAMQARLLRVLQEGEIRRVGGERTIRVDVRIVAATHRDLSRWVREGRFREDLLYRLQVLTLELPPLRQRPGDLPLLVAHLMERIGKERGRPAPKVTDEAMEIFERYGWPGNVRQLENVLQRLVLLAGERPIDRKLIESDPHLKQTLLAKETWQEPAFSLERNEREQIQRALRAAGGNRNRAARMLGISRATLYRRIREYGIS